MQEFGLTVTTDLRLLNPNDDPDLGGPPHLRVTLRTPLAWILLPTNFENLTH